MFNHLTILKSSSFDGSPHFQLRGAPEINGKAERTKHIYRDAAGKPGANRQGFVVVCHEAVVHLFFDKWTLYDTVLWVWTPGLEP
jgi:hypothetical protein